jgi:HEAT repeat protein
MTGGVTATELRAIDRLPEAVFDALVHGLDDPHPQVRYWSVQCLDHVADTRALDAVARLLEDPVDRVRRVAVHAIGCAACKPSATDELPANVLSRIAGLAATDASAKVRREAAWALACRRAGGPRPSVSGAPNAGR